MASRVGIGQDSHRFSAADSTKPLVIAGVEFDGPGFQANSDGDVVFHAICNALTSLHHVVIMGGVADELCLKDGITDSEVYLRAALEHLGPLRVTHVAITLEAKRPKLKDKYQAMRENVARVMGLDVKQVGITATSGEGLTDFGCGDGMQCFCIVTAEDVS